MVKGFWKAIVFVLLAAVGVVIGLLLYGLPATLTLPPGRRSGLPPLTLDDAARQLRASGKQGWRLVEAARALVGERMAYCRRNSFDSSRRAFERGYGYCQQSAFALADLLTRLDFDAKVVHAFRNRFPGGDEGGHAWVRVSHNSITHDIDPIFYDGETDSVLFTSLTPVLDYTPLFRVLAGWGSVAVNAHRYYVTGVDSDFIL